MSIKMPRLSIYASNRARYAHTRCYELRDVRGCRYVVTARRVEYCYAFLESKDSSARARDIESELRGWLHYVIIGCFATRLVHAHSSRHNMSVHERLMFDDARTMPPQTSWRL